ncbi:diaminopimelate epimerase [Candidatus Omnitrophota bacterium]
MEFIKAVASGNDFVLVDLFKNNKALTKNRAKKLAQQLCQRKLSVGADGLLVVERSQRADFKMRVINPDGSEVDMCGNGARCIALYAIDAGIVRSAKMKIETKAGILQGEVKRDRIKIKMSDAKDLRREFNLNINGQTYNVNYVNTGVPHVICFVQNLNNYDVGEIGRTIRYHPEFQPAGTNVDFVEVLDETHIKVRTYERGVEDETLACGTGCVAASIIAAFEMKQSPDGLHKIRVATMSTEALTVYFKVKKDNIYDVFLEGKAKLIYRGKVLEGV